MKLVIRCTSHNAHQVVVYNKPFEFAKEAIAWLDKHIRTTARRNGPTCTGFVVTTIRHRVLGTLGRPTARTTSWYIHSLNYGALEAQWSDASRLFVGMIMNSLAATPALGGSDIDESLI